MTDYLTQAGAIRSAMEIVECVDDMVKANPDEDYFELAQAAVYLQVAVNRLVWRLNEISNGRDD